MLVARLSPFVVEGCRQADEAAHKGMAIFRLNPTGGEATKRAAQQIGAGNSRRVFPFPGFGVIHTFFLSGTVAVGGCA
jgi:hypothetical protein